MDVLYSFSAHTTLNGRCRWKDMFVLPLKFKKALATSPSLDLVRGAE
jgi:hypothetical protein